MFQWNEEMVRFMRTASEYGDYHRRLVQRMRPALHSADHICDAGCGLGYLSLALAPYVRRVTAAEYRAAVSYMRACGITDGFVQERTSAEEAYTPAFGGGSQRGGAGRPTAELRRAGHPEHRHSFRRIAARPFGGTL